MTIEYIFRPKGDVSIEKVFASVIKAVMKRDDCTVRRSFVKAFRLWPIGILYNMLRYCLKSHIHKDRIYHITGDVQYVACLMNPQNTILTIHDLVPLRNRHVPWYSRILCYWLWYRFPLKHLHLITCISEATRQDLLCAFPWAEEKIKVVINPVDETFTYTPKPINVISPRILHIGTKENKNLLRVIVALNGHPCHLRIVGKLSKEQQDALANSSVEYSNVYKISDEQIIQEYKDADLVSFPSLFEGFGMPIIEGQAIGRPVITSNIEPMLSIAGGAAIIINPHDVESIRMGFFSHTEEELLQIVEKGIQNAKRFSSESVAADYMNIYNKCLRTS